jgi:peptidoglycan/xylan/chitin deacetylase (PgdA/CDA1 family)
MVKQNPYLFLLLTIMLLSPLSVNAFPLNPNEAVIVYNDSRRLNKAILVFSFDHIFKSVYTNAYPILTERGFVATAFILPSRTGVEPVL